MMCEKWPPWKHLGHHTKELSKDYPLFLGFEEDDFISSAYTYPLYTVTGNRHTQHFGKSSIQSRQ